jgi:uroporphyrinogen-III synthase
VSAERPLAGRVVLLTGPPGPEGRLVTRLERLGAAVENRPTIDFLPPRDPEPSRRAVSRLDEFDWLVFTSPRGVDHFRALHREVQGRDPAAAARPSIAAMGPATARQLARAGLAAQVTARESSSEGLARTLEGVIHAGDRVLVVRPEVGRDVVPSALQRLGAQVQAIAFYRTIAAPGLAQLGADIEAGRYDAVLFSSPSTLQYLLAASGERRAHLVAALGRTRIAAIGRFTARALEQAGLEARSVAAEPTEESVARSILALFA